MSSKSERSAAKLALYWALSVIIPVAIVLFLHLDTAAAIDFGIILFGICCLIFDLLPNYVVGLGIAFIPVLLNIVPAETALSPMLNWTWWSVIFGMIVGAAITKTGLGRRIGIAMASRFAKSWPMLIATIFIFETVMNVIAPFANVASIAIGLSIFIPIAKEFGFEPGTKGYTGIGAAVVVSNTVTGALLMTGHAMNALAVALFKPYFEINFMNWLQYITLPALLASIVSYFAIVIMCRPNEKLNYDLAKLNKDAAELPKFGTGEGKVLGIMIVIILGFLLQAVFNLPYTAGWLSMALAILLFVPGIGMLTGDDLKNINWPFVMFMIGVFSIGSQLGYTGVSTALAEFAMPASIAEWPTIGSNLFVYVVIVLLHFLCGTFAPLLSTLVPAFGAFGAAHGMNMIALFGTILLCRTRFVFPFQDAMMLMAKGMTKNALADKEIIKIGVFCTVGILVVVIPLSSLYWGLF